MAFRYAKVLGLLVLLSQLIWLADVSAQVKETVEYELHEGVVYKVVGEKLLLDAYIPKLLSLIHI